ncbi:unnamed protein product [Blepharisma stoltei]|uniref:Uncharacterized protein n=1 Tax=Blepharisma stoltei TaxID=1481888 RepID=A0AAU9K7M8_9CILI|nr:unnamed protein product [Blepharisma stoltei]
MSTQDSSNTGFTNRQKANQDLNLTIPEVDEVSIIKDEFSESVLSKIKVSKRNRIIKEKLGHEENDPQTMTQYSPEKVEEMVQEEVRNRRKYTGQQQNMSPGESLLKPSTRKLHIDNGSCFMCYIVKNKSLHDLIPDYELSTCKQVFEEMLQKLPQSNEANFGLGRVLAYEEKYEESIKHLRVALRNKPKDVLFLTWYQFVQWKLAGNRHDLLNLKEAMVTVLRENKKQIEILWGLMEISLSKQLECGSEIEVPQYYASNIKEIDTYYGYLAWSTLFLKQDQEEKGLDILQELIKSNPDIPEAYIVLWEHYYYKQHEYLKSEDLAAEAFLRITDYENHQYYILFCIIYAKSYAQNGKLPNCLELLMQKFNEHPTYTVFLYHYGRICAKSADPSYRGSAIAALEESLRLCNKTRFGKIYYWLAKVLVEDKQIYEASKAIKKARKLLPSTEVPKLNEIKQLYEDIRPKIELIDTLKNSFKANMTEEELANCKNLCDQVKVFSKEIGECYDARLLWMKGEEEEAIELLDEVSSSDTLYLKAYDEVFKYLKIQNNSKLLKKIGKAMISRCKVVKFPVSVWMKMHILYADVLSITATPADAIILLKCLAKVFPPLPFAEIPYTKTLKRAKNLDELEAACNKAIESSKSYSYTNYRNTQANILSEDYFESYLSKNNVEYKFKGLEDKKSKKLPVQAQQLSNDAFLVCSEPDFLYKIAKLAVKHHVHIDDGLCAIEDYLLLLKFNQRKKQKQFQRAKALYLKAFLLVEGFNLMGAIQLMEEALPLLEQVGANNKAEKVRKFLAEHS